MEKKNITEEQQKIMDEIKGQIRKNFHLDSVVVDDKKENKEEDIDVLEIVGAEEDFKIILDMEEDEFFNLIDIEEVREEKPTVDINVVIDFLEENKASFTKKTADIKEFRFGDIVTILERQKSRFLKQEPTSLEVKIYKYLIELSKYKLLSYNNYIEDLLDILNKYE